MADYKTVLAQQDQAKARDQAAWGFAQNGKYPDGIGGTSPARNRLFQAEGRDQKIAQRQ